MNFLRRRQARQRTPREQEAADLARALELSQLQPQPSCAGAPAGAASTPAALVRTGSAPRHALLSMGYGPDLALLALRSTGNAGVEAALEWILT